MEVAILYHKIFRSIRSVFDMTGCRVPCNRNEWSYKRYLKRIKVSFFLKPLQIQFFFSTDTFHTTSQYLAYDTQNLVADIGGYLGLLLGYSLFDFYDITKVVMSSLWRSKRPKKATGMRSL